MQEIDSCFCIICLCYQCSGIEGARKVNFAGYFSVSTLSYAYNGDGVRVAQIGDGLRTDYVQDVAAPLPQVLTARQGGTTSRYLRGLGLIGRQWGSSADAWQYHLPDALGSVRQVVDPQGAVTLGRQYDPFGGLMADTGSAASAYGFAGEEQNPDTEQVYLRARTYKPGDGRLGNGRFLQQDSLLGDPRQPRTLHRYSYAFNNPVNYTDPSGNMPPGGGNRSSNPGGAAPPPVTGTAVPLPGGSNPDRSANGGRPAPSATSSPNNKAKATGPACVVSFVTSTTRPFPPWAKRCRPTITCKSSWPTPAPLPRIRPTLPTSCATATRRCAGIWARTNPTSIGAWTT